MKPAPGVTIQPSTPIQLTFSQPVATALGQVRPTLDPPTPGTWTETAANQLTFTPTGSGFALGKHVVLTLPAPTDLLAPGKTETVRLAHLERAGRLDAPAAAAAERAWLPPAHLDAGLRAGRVDRFGAEAGSAQRAQGKLHLAVLQHARRSSRRSGSQAPGRR